MSMNVEIRVDAPQALPTIAGVEAALAKVEAKGPAVSDALSKGLGAGAPAADKTKKSTESATEALAKMAAAGAAFAGLAEQFKREGDMLEKIHGPAKQYQADLQALDGLLMRGAINIEEYTAQVTKMNAAIGEGPEKTEEAENSTNKLGEAFEALKLPAIGAGVLELGHKVAEMAEEADRAQDRFTELSNKALKFTDSTHSTTQVLAEQQAMSLKLNSTMDPTIELYDRVRIGSDNLRISHEEQLRMTQTLGEAMQIANKPMEAAGDIMNRFAFAMESGVTDVRSVKQVMLEVPEAAAIWRDSFHMTDQAILTAVTSGKLGARDLAVAWAQNGEAVRKVDEDFAKRQKTNEQAIKQLGEAINNLHQSGMNGMQANLAALAPDSLQAKIATEGFDFQEKDNGRAAQAVIDHMLQMAADAKNLTGEFRSLGDAKDKALGDMVEQIAELPGKLQDVTTGVMDLGRAVGVVADKWDQGLSPLGRVVKLTMDHAAAIGEAKLQLAALAEATKQGGVAGMEARKQYETLMTTLNNGELPAAIKLFDQLTDPIRVFHNDLAGMNQLFASGTADIDQYRAGIEKLVDALPKPSDHVSSAIEEINFQLDHFNNLLKVGVDMSTNHLLSGENLTSQFGRAADVGNVPSVADVATSAKENTAGFESTGDKYDKAVAELNSQKNLLSADNYARSLQNIKEQFGAAVSPAEKLAREQDDINALFVKGVLTYDDYKKKLEDIAKEQEKLADSGHDFASGLSRGFHSIRDEANDAASDISSTMKAAFDGVNDDIVSMVTTGSADWGKLASTIEADFAKMALHKIEGSIFDAASGSASGAAVGVTTGTSAATTMLAAAPGIGAAIGATAAAAIAAGSAASSAGEGIASAIAGSWAGSNTLIHAANGYSGKVGGVGGVDTKLFAAMVSPGEHVKIQTPQQAAADQRASSGGQNVTIVNKHDTRGELAQGLASGDHDTAVINILKRNAGAVQSLIRK